MTQMGALYPRSDSSHNGIELAFRFVLWAQQMHSAPTHHQIREHFGCSVATAFRWRAAWLAANGITPPFQEHKPCTVTRTKP